MIIYGLKTCDSCRAAIKALTAHGHDVRFVDVRATPLVSGDLDRFLAAFGDDLVNRRSTTWRGLSDDDRTTAPQALLVAHPALMKRPVIDHDGALYLGWTAAVKSALL